MKFFLVAAARIRPAEESWRADRAAAGIMCGKSFNYHRLVAQPPACIIDFEMIKHFHRCRGGRTAHLSAQIIAMTVIKQGSNRQIIAIMKTLYLNDIKYL